MRTSIIFLLPASLAVAAALPVSAFPPQCISKDGTPFPCRTSQAGTFIGVKANPAADLDSVMGKILKEQYGHLSPNNTRPYKKLFPLEGPHRPLIARGLSPNETAKYEQVEKSHQNVDQAEEGNGSQKGDRPADKKAAGKPEADSKEAEKDGHGKKAGSVKTPKKGKSGKKDEADFPVQAPGKEITGEEAAQKLQGFQVIIAKLGKVFQGFGLEGSGTNPDKEKAKNYTKIQDLLNEWIKGLQDLQSRMIGTKQWNIVGQMKVAQQYFEYAADVEHMLKGAQKNEHRFDRASHMRCEIATTLSKLTGEYYLVADHLYTKDKHDKKTHTSGRLLRSKFARPLPVWWNITHKDPKSGELIADWTKWNDAAYDPMIGRLKETLVKWTGLHNDFRVGKCQEMEPHGSW